MKQEQYRELRTRLVEVHNEVRTIRDEFKELYNLIFGKFSKEYHNVTDTCKMLGISRPTLMKHIHSGRIQAQRAGDNTSKFLIHIDEIERLQHVGI